MRIALIPLALTLALLAGCTSATSSNAAERAEFDEFMQGRAGWTQGKEGVWTTGVGQLGFVILIHPREASRAEGFGQYAFVRVAQDGTIKGKASNSLQGAKDQVGKLESYRLQSRLEDLEQDLEQAQRDADLERGCRERLARAYTWPLCLWACTRSFGCGMQ